MRKITYFVACSLDGYIAQKDGGIGWCFIDADYGYKAFYDSVDTLLMGRITFDLTRQWHERWPGKKVLVFSRIESRSELPEVAFTAEAPVMVAERLKKEAGGGIWLVGGFGLAGTLLRARLVDELVLSIHPVTLGDGIPLFPQDSDITQWRLVAADAFPSGLVQLRYGLKTREED